jgi:hypothetical protein
LGEDEGLVDIGRKLIRLDGEVFSCIWARSFVILSLFALKLKLGYFDLISGLTRGESVIGY